ASVFFQVSGGHQDLPSFPTRRSSDLPGTDAARAWRAGESARSLPSPARGRAAAGAAARRTLLGSRGALSTEAIRGGPLRVRRREIGRAHVAPRARSPLRPRPERPRAAAAGG